MSGVVTSDDLQSWAAGLDEVFARVASRFGRVEPPRQARAYLVGLLAPVERKNGWQLAEAAGDAQPHRMQADHRAHLGVPHLDCQSVLTLAAVLPRNHRA